jgi:hypothetical protein
MKNLGKQLLGICMIGVLTFSCNNNKVGHDTTMEIEDENRIINNDEGSPNVNTHSNEFGRDSLTQNREGTPINDRRRNMDDLEIPQPIMDAIRKDSRLSNAEIVRANRREESGQTLYDVTFQPLDGRQETVVFDINGKRRQ